MMYLTSRTYPVIISVLGYALRLVLYYDPLLYTNITSFRLLEMLDSINIFIDMSHVVDFTYIIQEDIRDMFRILNYFYIIIDSTGASLTDLIVV